MEFSQTLKDLGFEPRCNVRLTKQSLLKSSTSSTGVGTKDQGSLLGPTEVGLRLAIEVRDAVTGHGRGTVYKSTVDKIEPVEHGKALITTQTSIYLLELM